MEGSTKKPKCCHHEAPSGSQSKAKRCWGSQSSPPEPTAHGTASPRSRASCREAQER